MNMHREEAACQVGNEKPLSGSIGRTKEKGYGGRRAPWGDRARAYLACSDSRCLFRLATRCRTSASLPPLMLQNSRPQMGISREPWEAITSSPRMIDETFSAGYFPPFFLASTVRSAGGTFRAPAAGPLPLPSRPWQAAQ